ncbi:hypothetical protein GJAV_G00224060 [Gymnothorax javanicus]|nr:hypothetical protein GJAV_G00224060 [Gymnothorax javanicus]
MAVSKDLTSLKNGLRAHLADGHAFTTALQNTLLHYRATAHTTTGSSPALLMLGRELQLPLDRLRPPTGDTPATTPSSGDRVAARQHYMKQRFDRKHKAKCPALTVSNWVRIRRPSRSHKLLSFWSEPRQITAQLGPATFRLVDGSCWHASRLRRVTPLPGLEPMAATDLLENWASLMHNRGLQMGTCLDRTCWPTLCSLGLFRPGPARGLITSKTMISGEAPFTLITSSKENTDRVHLQHDVEQILPDELGRTNCKKRRRSQLVTTSFILWCSRRKACRLRAVLPFPFVDELNPLPSKGWILSS